MITISNFGWRMGNQLFQIAAGYATAKKNNTEFLCPEWKYQKYFKLKHKTYQGEPISEFYSEKGFHFLEIPSGNNMALNGYFQSEKYFKDIDINELFEFDFPFIIELDELKDFCSIHVRRGDYLKYPEHHPVCPESYYRQAIDVVYKSNGIFKFLICSDDINWCKSFFAREGFSNKLFLFSEDSEVTDLRKMSLCGHNIIANSTFSWWGAYLNQNPDKIVITPHRDNWHGDGYAHWDHSDLLPESWIKIKY